MAREAWRQAVPLYRRQEYGAARDLVRRAYQAWPGQPAYVARYAALSARLLDTAAVLEALGLLADLGLSADLAGDADFAALRDATGTPDRCAGGSRPTPRRSRKAGSRRHSPRRISFPRASPTIRRAASGTSAACGIGRSPGSSPAARPRGCWCVRDRTDSGRCSACSRGSAERHPLGDDRGDSAGRGLPSRRQRTVGSVRLRSRERPVQGALPASAVDRRDTCWGIWSSRPMAMSMPRIVRIRRCGEFGAVARRRRNFSVIRCSALYRGPRWIPRGARSTSRIIRTGSSRWTSIPAKSARWSRPAAHHRAGHRWTRSGTTER